MLTFYPALPGKLRPAHLGLRGLRGRRIGGVSAGVPCLLWAWALLPGPRASQTQREESPTPQPQSLVPL